MNGPWYTYRIDMQEIMAHPEFDIDSDGSVSEEEAKVRHDNPSYSDLFVCPSFLCRLRSIAAQPAAVAQR